MVDTARLVQTAAGGQEALYDGFGGPFAPLDVGLFQDIVVTSAQQYMRFFVETYQQAIEADSPDLLRFLGEGVERLSDFETAWDFAVFAIRECLLQRAAPDVALGKALQLGLRLAASGEGGSFRARTSRPIRPLWGKLILPELTSITVERDLYSATLALDKIRLELWRDGESWAGEEVDELPSIRRANVSAHLVVPAAAPVVGCDCVSMLSTDEVSRLQYLYQDAITLIEEGSPSYLQWVSRVLRYISPIEADPGVMRSGSGPEWPGLAEMSFRCDPIAVAEMLVHECSHQYFNALMFISPVADGSDTTLYFSPVRNCGRPIEMILLAYHAFGNVLLFYRECQFRGVDDSGFCERNEAELLPQLGVLEDALRATSSLTEVGHSLWQPLSALIGSVR
ncbi:HEXXH motif-containing putative peptide modification protein [Mesorhizobium sp.]|uniref:aKG-HExxH-type peptide beta-hydroxylase n=1 Tax=Mesorhizobium sp. TaxID=1871066 RepID=UPI00121FA568|nr:HEXXH motif-containing putative peptide modification protein [Mesorhizobium sp.]TIS62490.1 MAG: hypothetical protein E5W92_30820 [Mesorhizobium sp.]